MLEKIIFITNLVSTIMMCGIIWYAQIAVYSLLKFVGKKDFANYKKAYNKRVMPYAVFMLLVELSTSILLLWARPLEIPIIYVLVNLILLAIIWLLTWFVEVPKHKILESGFNVKSYKTLMITNLTRTVLWAFRVIIVVIMLDYII